jgi:hypothetical protein
MIVKPAYSPRLKMTVAVIFAIVAIVGGAAIYNYGLSSAGFESLIANRAQEGLENSISSLRDENNQLKGSLARAERTLQMDQAAYSELNQSLKQSAAEIAKLREDLNFYRNIISPANKKEGLRIQSLNIDKTTEKNKYKYKLVLIQALKHDHLVRGRANIEVSGLQAGKSAKLKFPLKSERKIGVNFRYFQEFSGQLKIPGNFQPKDIKIKVVTRGRNAVTVERSYNWPES